MKPDKTRPTKEQDAHSTNIKSSAGFRFEFQLKNFITNSYSLLY